MNLPIAEKVHQAKGWDAQMRELMLAGSSLAVLPEALRVAQFEVQGCESQVWLNCKIQSAGTLSITAWSTSKVIRGLLALMLEALQNCNVEEVLQFDMQAYMQQLGLERHLSQSRNSGLRAVMQHIQQQCRLYSQQP